jgi:hypothetical protein
LASPLQNPAAATGLISFLKALLDCRMRRGILFPQWWMLLVAILSILSGQGSLLGMERFAKLGSPLARLVDTRSHPLMRQTYAGNFRNDAMRRPTSLSPDKGHWVRPVCSRGVVHILAATRRHSFT